MSGPAGPGRGERLSSDWAGVARGGAARRLLWVGLAVLWSMAALLKLQPGMFTPAFFVNVMGPVTVDDQPPWLDHLLAAFDRLWVHHIVAGDLLLFAVEALTAILIWSGPDRRSGRWGLWLSLGWGLLVWALGEGFGGLFTGDASVAGELPGSALLYAALGALLLVPEERWREGRMAEKLRTALGLFWVLAALWQALPAFWNGPTLGEVFGDLSMNGHQVPLLAMVTNAMLVASLRSTSLVNGILIVAMALQGFMLLTGRAGTAWAILTGLWLAFSWVVVTGLGGLGTGTATDPGTAFPLALMAAAVWVGSGARAPSRKLSSPHSPPRTYDL